MPRKATANVYEPIGDILGNGAAKDIAFQQPYTARIEVEGSTAILFHRWDVEGVQEKADAAKGSKAKKSDNVDTYVYRDERGHLAIPGEYFRMSIVNAAKFRQDPRSPRKSAMDLFKAGIVVLDEFCSLGVKEWDYLDKRRVTIQRNGITRSRPAMRKGWKVIVTLQVVLPEYIDPQVLNEVVQMAGRVIGVADFRPSYGRFLITKFETK